MNLLLEKQIKRMNKKRGKNITIATMVIFLLSCITTFSIENIETIDVWCIIEFQEVAA